MKTVYYLAENVHAQISADELRTDFTNAHGELIALCATAHAPKIAKGLVPLVADRYHHFEVFLEAVERRTPVALRLSLPTT